MERSKLVILCVVITVAFLQGSDGSVGFNEARLGFRVYQYKHQMPGRSPEGGDHAAPMNLSLHVLSVRNMLTEDANASDVNNMKEEKHINTSMCWKHQKFTILRHGSDVVNLQRLTDSEQRKLAAKNTVGYSQLRSESWLFQLHLKEKYRGEIQTEFALNDIKISRQSTHMEKNNSSYSAPSSFSSTADGTLTPTNKNRKRQAPSTPSIGNDKKTKEKGSDKNGTQEDMKEDVQKETIEINFDELFFENLKKEAEKFRLEIVVDRGTQTTMIWDQLKEILKKEPVVEIAAQQGKGTENKIIMQISFEEEEDLKITRQWYTEKDAEKLYAKPLDAKREVYLFANKYDRKEIRDLILEKTHINVSSIEIALNKKWCIVRTEKEEEKKKIAELRKITCKDNTYNIITKEDKHKVVYMSWWDNPRIGRMGITTKMLLTIIQCINKKAETNIARFWIAKNEFGQSRGYAILVCDSEIDFTKIQKVTTKEFKIFVPKSEVQTTKDIIQKQKSDVSYSATFRNTEVYVSKEPEQTQPETWNRLTDVIVVIGVILKCEKKKTNVVILFFMCCILIPKCEAADGMTHRPPTQRIQFTELLTTTLVIVALNINGNLMEKRKAISEMVAKWNADIVFLSETWITENQLKTSRIHEILKTTFNQKYEIAAMANGKETKQKTKKSGSRETQVRSKGMIALVKNEIMNDVKSYEVTNDNRVIRLNLQNKNNKEGKNVQVWGIYGTPHTNEKDAFYEQLNKDIQKVSETMPSEQTIIIGDFNVAPNPSIDRDNGSKATSEQKAFDQLLVDNQLTDVWRYKHPNDREYSFLRVCKKNTENENRMIENEELQVQRSRIDLAITDAHTAKYEVVDCEIKKNDGEFHTDHFPIRLEIYYNRKSAHSEDSEFSEHKTEKRMKINQKAFQDEEKRVNYRNTLESKILNELNTRNGNRVDFQTLETLIREAAATSVGIRIIDLKGRNEKRKAEEKRKIDPEEIEILQKLRKCDAALRKRRTKRQWTKVKLQQLGKMVDIEYKDETEEIWWKNIRRTKRKLQKELKARIRTHNSKQVKENVKIVKALLQTDPKKFWRSVNVSKSINNENINAIKMQLSDNETIITQDPQLINKTLVKEWSNVYSNNGIVNDWQKVPHLAKTANFYREKFDWQNNGTEIEQVYRMEELELILKESGNNKATNSDIPIEAYKYAGQLAKTTLLNIINQYWIYPNEIPSEWTDTLIRLIPKAGDKYKALNKRPISMTNAAMTLMMKMFQKRLQTIIEKTGVILDEQGGFRRNRTTHDKINALLKMMAETKHPMHKRKKFYILFVDIKKCYDTVNHSMLLKTLEAMGFPERVTNFTQHVYRNYYARIIGADGKETEKFKLEKGIRQGCPSSCPMIDIFFDPIIRTAMNKLQEENTHYGGHTGKVEESETLQWVDDIAMMMWDRKKFLEQTHKLVTTLEEAGLEIGVDNMEASKTVVMTNDEQFAAERHVILDIQKNKSMQSTTETLLQTDKRYTIPIITNKQSYKYLGYWINAELDMSEHLQKLENTVKLHTRFIQQRCHTPKVTVQIMNQIIIPTIEYKLSAIPWCEAREEMIKRLERTLVAVANRKMGIRAYETPIYTHLQPEYGGLGLHSVKSRVDTATLKNLVLHGLESLDQQCKQIVTKENESFEKMSNLIGEEYNLQVERISGKEITKIGTFLTTDSKYGEYKKYEREQIEEQSKNKKVNIEERRAAKEILQIIQSNAIVDFLTAKGKIPNVKYKHESADIYSDASGVNAAQVTYAVYVPTKEKLNFQGGVQGSTSVQRAELLGTIHALLVALRFENGRVISDNKAAVGMWHLPMEALAKRREAPNRDLLEIIHDIRTQMMEQRRTIKVEHILAHSTDHPDKEERKRRKQQNEQIFGQDTETITQGNKVVDEMAKQASNEPEKACIYRLPKYVTLKTKWIVSEKSAKEVIYNIRQHIDEHQKRSNVISVKERSCYQWLRDENNIDVSNSNYIMTISAPERADTQKLISRMRRKQIADNGWLYEHRENTYIQDRFGIPKDNTCPLCGKPETRMHFAFECEKNRFLQKQLFRKVSKTLFQHFGISWKDIPNWLNNAEGGKHIDGDDTPEVVKKLMNFPKDHSALGIIPADLKRFIAKYGRKNIERRTPDPNAYAKAAREIHLANIENAIECYKRRCRTAAVKQKGKLIKAKKDRTKVEQETIEAQRRLEKARKSQLRKTTKEAKDAEKEKKRIEKEQRKKEAAEARQQRLRQKPPKTTRPNIEHDMTTRHKRRRTDNQQAASSAAANSSNIDNG